MSYSEAATWAEKVLDKASTCTGAHAYAILAMAHWQLGHQVEARAMLAKGEKLAPPTIPDFITAETDESWAAWLMARIVLDEGKLLIPSLPSEQSLNKP